MTEETKKAAELAAEEMFFDDGTVIGGSAARFQQEGFLAGASWHASHAAKEYVPLRELDIANQRIEKLRAALEKSMNLVGGMRLVGFPQPVRMPDGSTTYERFKTWEGRMFDDISEALTQDTESMKEK